MLRFACANCTERLVVPERFAGRKGKCPACGTVNRVPTTSPFAEPFTAPTPLVAPVPLLPSIVQQSPIMPPVGPEALRPTPAVVEVEPSPAPVLLTDSPGKMVAVNPLDDLGLPAWIKWLAVLGILLLLLAAVWVIFYLLVWTQVKLNQ